MKTSLLAATLLLTLAATSVPSTEASRTGQFLKPVSVDPSLYTIYEVNFQLPSGKVIMNYDVICSPSNIHKWNTVVSLFILPELTDLGSFILDPKRANWVEMAKVNSEVMIHVGEFYKLSAVDLTLKDLEPAVEIIAANAKVVHDKCMAWIKENPDPDFIKDVAKFKVSRKKFFDKHLIDPEHHTKAAKKRIEIVELMRVCLQHCVSNPEDPRLGTSARIQIGGRVSYKPLESKGESPPSAPRKLPPPRPSATASSRYTSDPSKFASHGESRLEPGILHAPDQYASSSRSSSSSGGGGGQASQLSNPWKPHSQTKFASHGESQLEPGILYATNQYASSSRSSSSGGGGGGGGGQAPPPSFPSSGQRDSSRFVTSSLSGPARLQVPSVGSGGFSSGQSSGSSDSQRGRAPRPPSRPPPSRPTTL